MKRVQRIFLIANFRNHSATSIQIECRHWIKGLVRLGHDVQRFSYQNIKRQNFGKRKLFTKRYGTEYANKAMIEQVKNYQPDIVLILAMKGFTAEAVVAMRQVAPNAVFVGRDGDPFPETQKGRVEIGQQMNVVIATNAGRFLRTYKEAGVPICAFIPNLCDPDIQKRYEVNQHFKSDIIFTGTAGDNKRDFDSDRYYLIQQLSKMPNARLYGAFGNPTIEGIDYFYALSGAKIALSINRVNDVKLYHSDRLTHYLACGTFVLAKRVPSSDLLFQDTVHLRYFDTPEEFFDLADWYLQNEQEREKIAAAGMERVHSEFNCVKIAQHFLDLVGKGHYDASWAYIL